MADAKFAIPLDDKSIQTGEINFKSLATANQPATFLLTNMTPGTTNVLDLITSKGGATINHPFTAAVSNGQATVNLTSAQLRSIYADTDGVDWDYVEAQWTVGGVDTPVKSSQYELQSGGTYDMHDWPPKMH